MVLDKQRRTFLSYSRANKDFARKLAGELKSEGFSVWLDQLDIPAGSRWDREVEKALKECEIFMIILTPASINSENVLDEIGYAIDNGKRILPVLLENCEVPLRLRRFQYVDFTRKSFDEGVQSARELLEHLSLGIVPMGNVTLDRAKSPLEIGYSIAGVLVFLFIIGAIADVFGAWNGIKEWIASSFLKPECPYAADSDSSTIANIIQAEATAANTEDISIIRTIFAPDATIRFEGDGREWHDPVARYQEIFKTIEMTNAVHFGIQPTGRGITKDTAWFISGSSGFWAPNGEELASYYNEPGKDSWVLKKNMSGCWVIAEYRYN